MDSSPMLLDAAAAARRILEGLDRGCTIVEIRTLTEGERPRRRLFEAVATPGALGPSGTLGSLGPLESLGSLGSPAYDAAADDLAARLLAGEVTEGVHACGPDAVRVHAEIHRPPDELVIVGAGHIAQPLAEVGALLGFRVLVLDDRPAFATRERFPGAHAVLQVDFTAPFADVRISAASRVVLVTRGHRHDFECLRHLLLTPPHPRYIGMLGSRRRVRATLVQLVDEQIPRERLATIHAPLGLDIGAQTPAEIAVAIAADLVRDRHGGSGRPLDELERVLERLVPERTAQ